MIDTYIDILRKSFCLSEGLTGPRGLNGFPGAKGAKGLEGDAGLVIDGEPGDILNYVMRETYYQQ